MSIFVTSKKFYDEFTGVSGGGVDYLYGCIGDKITCVINFYIKWSSENKRLQFTSATKTIENVNPLDRSDFISDGFKVGDTFDVTDTISNNGSYTIAEISSDGRKITTVEALVDETDEDCSLFGTTPVVALDYFYNLIKNSEVNTFKSKTDRGTTQKFLFKDLDASNTVALKKGIIGTTSWGWVTNEIFDEITAEVNVSQLSIIGDGITDYKQKFILNHTFFITPLYLRDQLFLFANKIPPEYFQDEEALKFVARLDAKYDFDTSEVAHTIETNGLDGLTVWFDRDPNGKKPEYEVVSIDYVSGSNTLERLDINKSVDVTIKLHSKSGFFTTGAMPTDLVLHYFYCPLNEEDYINTNNVLKKNYLFDRAFNSIGASAIDGESAGDYQSIFNYSIAFVDVYNATLTFTINHSNFIKNLLKSKSDDNRFYCFFVTTQRKSITTTRGVDRVAVLCDFENADYDKTNADLFELTSNGVMVYPYPYENTNNVGEIAGFEGDPFYIRIPFLVETGFYGKCKSIATFTGSSLFSLTYQINGIPAIPPSITFDSSNVSLSKSDFQNFLDMYFPEFTCELTYIGASMTWILEVVTNNPGGIYEGIVPTVILLGPIVSVTPFSAIESTDIRPTINKIVVQVKAEKSGYQDFVLEKKDMDTSRFRKLLGIQTIDINETRGFITYDDDPRNRVKLFRDYTLDNGSKKGFELQYGLVLRYEYWREVIQLAEGAAYDIFKDIENVTHQWSNYSSVNGWNLKFTFTCFIEGYDGFENEYQVQTDMRVIKGGGTPELAPDFTVDVKFYTEDGLTEIKAIDKDNPTLIKATFTCFGTITTFPASYTKFYGIMFADFQHGGGIFSRRFASSEIPSESDSPWKPTTPDPIADYSLANGNVTIDVYNAANKAVVSGYFDSSKFDVEKILIYPRLGYRYT